MRPIFRTLIDIFSLPDPEYPKAFFDLADEYRREIPDFPLRGAYVAYAYSQSFAQDLKRFKYRSDRVLLSRFSPGLRALGEHCRRSVPRNAFVAYPPSPFSRTLIRGYDHTELFARIFAQSAGLPLVRLIRTPVFRPRQA